MNIVWFFFLASDDQDEFQSTWINSDTLCICNSVNGETKSHCSLLAYINI